MNQEGDLSNFYILDAVYFIRGVVIIHFQLMQSNPEACCI